MGRGSRAFAWGVAACVLAGGVAVLFLGGRAVREAAERAEAAPTPERCLDDERPFGSPATGMRYEPGDPALEQQMRDELGDGLGQFEVRVVRRQGENVGLIMAMTAAGEAAGFAQGVVDMAHDEGAASKDGTVAGQDVTLIEADDRGMVVGRRDCAHVLVTAVDVASARAIARPILR